MKKLRLQIHVATALLGLFLPTLGLAADAKPLNLITSPLPINLSTAPGTVVSADLRVKQNSGTNERLRIDLMKFGAFGTDGRPRLLDRAPGDDYFDWVKFDKPTFDAPNNVWQTVKMSITVPKTAAFGYYYAVVFSREGDAVRSSVANTNSLNGGSAVLVLLDAKVPGAKREVTAESLVSVHNVYEFLPATFKATLKNTGNVHVIPKGNVFILKGKTQIAALSFNGEQGNILPGSRRVYQTEWTDGFPHFEKVVEGGKVKIGKDGEPATKLVWGDSGSGGKVFSPHVRMGQYTAKLFAVYDDGTRDVPVEAEVSFWVMPWKFFLSVIVAILVLYFLVRLGLRLYKKRIMAQMRKNQ